MNDHKPQIETLRQALSDLTAVCQKMAQRIRDLEARVGELERRAERDDDYRREQMERP